MAEKTATNIDALFEKHFGIVNHNIDKLGEGQEIIAESVGETRKDLNSGLTALNESLGGTNKKVDKIDKKIDKLQKDSDHASNLLALGIVSLKELIVRLNSFPLWGWLFSIAVGVLAGWLFKLNFSSTTTANFLNTAGEVTGTATFALPLAEWLPVVVGLIAGLLLMLIIHIFWARAKAVAKPTKKDKTSE